jgi:hypothetical protein
MRAIVAAIIAIADVTSASAVVRAKIVPSFSIAADGPYAAGQCALVDAYREFNS